MGDTHRVELPPTDPLGVVAPPTVVLPAGQPTVVLPAGQPTVVLPAYQPPTMVLPIPPPPAIAPKTSAAQPHSGIGFDPYAAPAARSPNQSELPVQSGLPVQSEVPGLRVAWHRGHHEPHGQFGLNGHNSPQDQVRLVPRPAAWWYSVCLVFFVLYVGAVALLTLIPNLDATAVPAFAQRIVNWLARHGWQITISQLEQISNFLMFIPFGILGTLLLAHRLTPRLRKMSVRGEPGKKLRKGLRVGRAAILVCLAAVLFSVGIESLQNVIPGRVSDPRDIILNGSGAIFGAIIITMVIWFFQFWGWTFRLGDRE